ncbi:hypothetical protein ACA910_014614 [Epithemia clementina (nom. ined.)]
MSSTSGYWKPAPASLLRGGGMDEDSSGRTEDAFASVVTPAPRNVSLARQRMLLPIYKHKRQIIYSIENYGCLIIVGETGSGKSTQIPQYLHEAGWAQHGFQIVCSQPRRLAATSLAQRVAEEMGTRSGDLVGYTVRFDDQSSEGMTQIKYVTDGILLREATLHDPLLSKYSVIICDEAHERNLNTDVLLGLLKKIREKRKDLRLIVCSATIDAKAFLDFFVATDKQDVETAAKKSRWGDKVGSARVAADYGTIISVDGRQFNVDTFYAQSPFPNYLEATIDTCKKIHSHEGPGHVLCFLPSGEDIDDAIRMAVDRFENDLRSVEFVPLYGSLPQYMQARIFEPSNNQKKRRFVFATNIAETSITVPDICFVVDSGLVKLPYFDPVTSMERLIVGAISQASARQRSGRAGRVQSGKCFRLYTEKYYQEKMQAQTLPEIVRTNLTSLVLTLKALGVENILTFDFMDQPGIVSISHALETLYALGAMDGKTNLTHIGMDLSRFPTEPRVARMLLESLSEKCAWEVLAVASALQVRDLFQRPNAKNRQKVLDYQETVAEFADPSGDHVTYANLLSEVDDRQWAEGECREKFVNYAALRRACEIRRQLARFLRAFGAVNALGITDGDGTLRSRAIRRCVTAGFFFNVAKLGPDGRYYTLRKNILVTPSSNSIFSTHGGLMGTEYIIYGETVDGVRGGIELKAVSSVEASWLKSIAPHYWE